MDSSSSSSSSSDDEDGIFRNMFVALLTLNDVNEVTEDPRLCLLGLDGTGKLERKKPRKYNEARASYSEQHRRNHLASPWAVRYFTTTLLPTSLSFDTFRQKFRLPYPMFNWIVREARSSCLFPDEIIRKRGPTPAPLNLKSAASLRYLATGFPIDGNEKAAGLGRSTM